MVDNQGQDTSPNFEDAFTAPTTAEESSLDNTLSPVDAFTEPSGDSAPVEGQPEQTETPQPEGNKNDDTRYEYWQSQASKAGNENQKLQQQLQQMQGYIQGIQQNNQPVQKQAEPEEEFPAPPDRPSKPAGYSREEAYTDPSSASAQYVNELDEWRDSMDEYNTAKTNYSNAVLMEKMQTLENQRIEDARRVEAQQQAQHQKSQVSQYVQSQYGFNNEEAAEFIAQMSDPKAVTMDSLVQLYRMKKGQAAPNEPVNAPAPSDAFQQVQRAQQVPQPMGVQASSGSEDPRSTEDQIMDSMLGDFKRNNPW
tara:strand:- start:172 stop:1098 length:927 start_codon:yes stop_codon:yes gene_type:complete